MVGEGLWEGGGGGRAGDGVVGEDSIVLGDRRRRPGKQNLSFSRDCC